MKEGSEGSGEKEIIFKEVWLCFEGEKNGESKVYKIEKKCFKILHVLTHCLEGLSGGGKTENAGEWGLVTEQALESGRGRH